MTCLLETSDAIHVDYIRLALEQARKSEYKATAFCVGAVITALTDAADTAVISCGYSREIPAGPEGELHAEHCAIVKAQRALGQTKSDETFKRACMYTTMEPCSVRTSGKRPCADRIIECDFQAVYLGVTEPGDFVICEGVQKLLDAGIKVYKVIGLEEECLKVARGES